VSAGIRSRAKRRRLRGLLVLAGERLVRRLVFSLAQSDDERVVAVFSCVRLPMTVRSLSMTVQRMTVPSSEKYWVMPSFLPMMPGWVFMGPRSLGASSRDASDNRPTLTGFRPRA
jgi:hypothetical protein